jgi:hypothetical protein
MILRMDGLTKCWKKNWNRDFGGSGRKFICPRSKNMSIINPQCPYLFEL